MNIIQIKAVFDSLGIPYIEPPADIPDGVPARLKFGKEMFCRFCLEPFHEYWYEDNPALWVMYRWGREDTTISDEFELQDWLINEFPTS